MVPIRVMSSPSGLGASANQTVRMLVAALPPSIVSVPFAWGRALRGGYDVLHVHWPELLLRGRPLKRFARRAAFVAIVVANRVRRVPMVWTVHNLRPHERSSPIERALLALWDRSVAARIFLYESGLPVEPQARDVVIPRGDYAPIYGSRPAGVRPTDDRVLTFGLVRRYKGIESLIDVIAAQDRPPRAVIAGPASDRAYADELVARAAGNPAIKFDLRFVPEGELGDIIAQSTLVVLPYRAMYNSGVALLALTRGRPILVPASPTMLELRAEVGEAWVITFEGELTAGILSAALGSARSIPDAAAPDLSARDWATVGARHAELYARLTDDR